MTFNTTVVVITRLIIQTLQHGDAHKLYTTVRTERRCRITRRLFTNYSREIRLIIMIKHVL